MRLCVITGGAGGMGIDCAKIMGKREKLLLVDVSQEKLDSAVDILAEEGIQDVQTAVCDISDRAAVKALAERAAGLGTIGSVLHLAGVGSYMPAEVVINVNAVGVYNMIEEFYEVMGEGSNMITINSLSTHINARTYDADPEKAAMLFDDPGDPEFAAKLIALVDGIVEASGGRAPRGGIAYGTAKYFSKRYSMRNVVRYASKGIRINTVTPGCIETPMAAREGDGPARMVAQMAIQKYGSPAEMAAVICWLTEPCARVMTGVDIPLDGGFIALMQYRDLQVQ